MKNRCDRLMWVAGVWLLSSLGCAATPYRYGHFDTLPGAASKPDEVAVDYGQPHKTLDRLGWWVGLPARVFPLHPGVNNHQVSEETTEKVTTYLSENDLTDVYVRINQYDPSSEWRRLRENQRIAPGWRYSFGMLSMMHYTLLPGRVFGGDWYNPYTNSLYINSDVPALLLHEAAFAKDVHSRRQPGAYVAVNHIPLLWLWRQTVAVNDILGYAQANRDWELEKQTYHVVYPMIGAHTTMAVSPLAPFGYEPILGLGGAVVGHATGRTIAARRASQLEDADPVETDLVEDIQMIGHTTDQPTKGTPPTP